MSAAKPGPLASVRHSCARVATNAQLVRVNTAAIEPYAAAFAVDDARRKSRADRVTASGSQSAVSQGAVPHRDAERTIALTLACAAVSFTSGWHDIMPKRPGLSGAVSTVARLVEYEAATGALSPDRLLNFIAADASQVFEIPLDGGALEELVELLAATLNQLGRMADTHAGFALLVGAADGSADRFTGILGALPSFHDVAPLDGETVHFYKRAQMATAQLAREFAGEGPGRFDDLDRLTVFADNLVPHVMRLDGLLAYDPALLEVIDQGGLLEHGSRAEVEIRACGVHVAELLVAELDRQGRPITAAELDHALWTRGGQPHYKAVRRHRCRNPFY